jgi:hypothetical protein
VIDMGLELKTGDKMIITIAIVVLILAGIGIALYKPNRTDKPNIYAEEGFHAYIIPESTNSINDTDNITHSNLYNMIQNRIDRLEERQFVLFKQLRINLLERLKEVINV